MQPKQVPRLHGPASGSVCHSAAGLATVSGGALTRIEVAELYTDRLNRFFRLPGCPFRIAQDRTPPVAGSAESQLERVMLLTRLARGCPVTELESAGRDAAAKAVADGLADPGALAAGRVVLTLRGRLLADAVIRDLTA